MSTILVLLMTLAEMTAVTLGYFVPMPKLFDVAVVYGSPLYFIINLLGSGSIAFEQHVLFPLIALFHVLKYIFLCHSQFNTERPGLHYTAATLEVFYLIICAYYL